MIKISPSSRNQVIETDDSVKTVQIYVKEKFTKTMSNLDGCYSGPIYGPREKAQTEGHPLA